MPVLTFFILLLGRISSSEEVGAYLLHAHINSEENILDIIDQELSSFDSNDINVVPHANPYNKHFSYDYYEFEDISSNSLGREAFSEVIADPNWEDMGVCSHIIYILKTYIFI